MKRLPILIAILLVLAGPAAALAGSAYANARADFGTLPDRGVPDASGHAILNYAKGQGKWLINGEVQGLLPETEYKLQVGVQDVPNPRYDVGYFTTDGSGKANFHFVSTNLLEAYSGVRVIDPAGNMNPRVGGTIVLWGREDGTIGSLVFRGVGRSE